jgi:hypothetical protein
MSKTKRSNKKQNNNNRKISSQSLVPAPKGNLIPSSLKRVERTVIRLSGASFTNATSAGYSWFTIDSTTYSAASPWTALSALYAFVRPMYCRVTVTACRATATSDNPVVAFVPTPDGTPVGNTSINISSFEAPTSISRSLGPGQEVSYTFRPYVAVAAYNAPSNGYMPMMCPRLSLNSMPRVYYGDILILTPGVNLVTTANYLNVKIEHVFEFDTIDPSNIQ